MGYRRIYVNHDMKQKDFLKYIDQHEDDFFHLILKKAGIGTWLRDNQRDLVRLDETMISLWGMEVHWSPGQWIPFTEKMLPMISGMSITDQNKFKGVIEGEDQDNFFVVQHKINRPDGEVKNCEVRIEVHTRDEKGVPLAISGVNIDNSDLITPKQNAYFDQLTKIHNRIKLYEKYDQGIPVTPEQDGRLVLLLGLDSCKEINDSRGRDIGDLALRAFAKSIYSNIRDDDEIFRLGGDEFVVITSNVSRTIARRLVERILLHVSQVQRPVRLSGSIGGVHLAENASLASALSLAEEELYKVKSSNRGTYSLR